MPYNALADMFGYQDNRLMQPGYLPPGYLWPGIVQQGAMVPGAMGQGQADPSMMQTGAMPVMPIAYPNDINGAPLSPEDEAKYRAWLAMQIGGGMMNSQQQQQQQQPPLMSSPPDAQEGGQDGQGTETNANEAGGP